MSRVSRWAAWCLWLTFSGTVALPSSCFAEGKIALKGGWSIFVPYSYVENVQGISEWRGLDVELIQEIEKESGYDLQTSAIAWPDLLQGVKTGAFDFAPIATRTSEREEFATFSVPYRNERTVLILRRGKSGALSANNAAELVAVLKKSGFRLGVGESVAYPSKEFREFIADPSHSDQIVILPWETLLPELLAGNVDGYLSDRLSAAAVIEAHGAGSKIEEHPVHLDGDLHLMLSKASVPENVVADINLAIEEVRKSVAYRQLNEKYTFPILVRLTLNSNWFLLVDIIGTIAFALSGVLIAIRYDYDIFGAMVLASLPAIGGGVVRDVITNREALALFSSPLYLQLIVGTVITGFIIVRIARALRRRNYAGGIIKHLQRRREMMGHLIQICDAIGLAAFTVTGVAVAVGTQSQPLWLWGPILASITAAGGGILRDVVRSEPEISVLKGELYPEIALFWGALLSFYMIWQARYLNANLISLGVAITFAGAVLTRIAVIYFNVRSPRLSV